jgi:hypothetical protein
MSEFVSYPLTLNKDIIENKAAEVKFIVKAIIPSIWFPISDESIEVNYLCGGITNTLLLVTDINSELSEHKVIVRIFGFGTSKFIDRLNENTVFNELSKRGIGPKFYGLFENGRIEGFLNGQAVTVSEMSLHEVAISISKSLAIFHSQKIHGINENIFIWNKLETFFRLIEGKLYITYGLMLFLNIYVLMI